MSDPIQKLRAEHANMARLLDLLESQIGLFHDGAQTDYELMLDIVYYLTNFPDQFHHRIEDAAFAKLAERDPSVRAEVNRLLGEHQVLAASGKQLLERLEAVVNGTVTTREAIEVPAATYVSFYRHHLNREEVDLFSRAERLFGAEDWRAVGSAVDRATDPLFGSQVEQRYLTLRKQIEAMGADAC